MGFKMKGFTPFTQSRGENEEALEEYLEQQSKAQEAEDNRMWIHKGGSYTGSKASPMNQVDRKSLNLDNLKEKVNEVKDNVTDTLSTKSNYKPPVIPNFKGGGLGKKIKNFFTKNTPTHQYKKWDKTFAANNPLINISRAEYDSLKRVNGDLKFNYKYNVGTDSVRTGTHSMNMKDNFWRVNQTGKRKDRDHDNEDTRRINLIPKSHYKVSDRLYDKAETLKWGLNAEERKKALKGKDPRLSDEKLDNIWKKYGPGSLGGELTGK
jgi:hypothetical protein